MPMCAAYGCNNNNVKQKELSFFTFPIGEPDILCQWVRNSGRAKWTPSKYSVLCSTHFQETCFEQDVYLALMGQDPTKRRRRRSLKRGSVPTIFQHKPEPKQRLLPTKRAVKREHEKVSELARELVPYS